MKKETEQQLADGSNGALEIPQKETWPALLSLQSGCFSQGKSSIAWHGWHDLDSTRWMSPVVESRASAWVVKS